MNISINVPDLEHDKMMASKYGHKVTPQGRLERRVCFAFMEHMKSKGWNPFIVVSDEDTPVTDAKSAMEIIFNLDDCWVCFKNASKNKHEVYLVLGNGCDLLSDWRYSDDDADGFNAAIESFDPEQFA